MTNNLTTYPIDETRPHAFSILERLWQLVQEWSSDATMRSVAIAIIHQAGYRDGNSVPAADALRQWVMGKMRWVADPFGTEFVVAPKQLLREILADGRAYGDCDDFVALFCSLARSIGLDARPVGVRMGTDPSDPTRFDHVIASIRFPDAVRDYDLCAKFYTTPEYLERLVIP
jgi:transglutaminase-like putative cysteine protease